METDEISFEDLGLDETTLAAVTRKGFESPSPIQVLAIPRLLNGDANVIAKARTGTGKTAAFGLPLVQTLRTESDHVRAIILEPTRELAVQTCNEMQSFTTGRFPRTVVVYGGASMGEQIRDLRRGTEIVVGTPGRIQDHIKRGTLNIEKIDYFILDEGDEMLDMGFIDDIEAIFAKANPASRILLFSATMPEPILRIARKFMSDYEIVEEEEATEEPLLIEQKYWFVRENEKIEALVRLIDISPDFYGLVFTQTKSDADLVSRQLDERGYEVAALHGDIPQSQREKILARFRSRKTRILVATDVAARGIDITGLSHVVNYSLPFDGSTYVHRIGRTGRAGAAGCSVTFVRPEERRKLAYLQSAVRKASKGEMTAGEIPSVDAVLEVKRNRMFNDVKKSICVPVKTESESDEVIPLEADSEVSVPQVISADPVFEKMASDLCMNQSPEKVLAAVLSVTYGKKLDRARYGSVASAGMSMPGQDTGNQMRLFVQLGRRDGYNARELADYFSGLLHIPGRMVDRIDISANFSLVSLPVSAGNKALDMLKHDKTLPHMHIDSRAGEGSGSDRRHEGRNRSDSEYRSRPARSFGGRSGGHSRINVHVPTERRGNAALYKRRASGAETF
jgi:ATP-dependent RNA helicase DeaD